MKNKFRIMTAAIVFTLCAGLLAGCGNTKVVVTSGLSSDELFRIGSVSCKLPEALVYLTNQKNQYEKVYGIEMWEHQIGDLSLEEYLKNQTVSQLAQVKSMVLLAKENEIVLDEEELEKSKEAAAEYYGSLSEEEIQALKISQELLETMYQDYCLAFKAYDEITQEETVEISDDQARIIELQQIFVPEENLARELKGKLDKGESFESLAANYSKASQMTVKVARGEKSESYEEVAFQLHNEEISEVVAADGGYYILKCTNTFLKEESEQNKLKVAREQKTERFQKVYSELMEDTLSEFQDKLWEKVTFENYDTVKTSTFFDVYQSYFSKSS